MAKTLYISKKKGLKIMIECAGKRYNREQGRDVNVPERSIKFIDCKFATDDKDEIKFIEDYMKRKQGMIVPVGEEIKRLQKAIENVKEQEKADIERLITDKTGRKGKQGVSA